MHDAPPFAPTLMSAELAMLLGRPAHASTSSRAYSTWRVEQLNPSPVATGRQIHLEISVTRDGGYLAHAAGITPKAYVLPAPSIKEAVATLAQALNLPPLTSDPVAPALSEVLRAAAGLPPFIPPPAPPAPVKSAAQRRTGGKRK